MNSYPSAFDGIQPETLTLNCRGRLLDLSVPVVMGIVNITRDSFYDGGKFTEESAIIGHVSDLIRDGAQLIDIGAVSTRPGADEVALEEEIEVLIPAVLLIRNTFPDIYISVDTQSSIVAKKALEAGADIINDVSGGATDPQIYEVVAHYGAPYVLMHMQGIPATMQDAPVYEDVVREVMSSLVARIAILQEKGIKDIIIDPGFGFGKDVPHNYSLLKWLQVFHLCGCPLLVGFSRKSMINKVLHTKPEGALNGTTVLNTLAVERGAHILRVHDAKEAKQVIQLFGALKQAN